MSRPPEARNVEFLTDRQKVVVECVERHGGNLTAAARELAVTNVSIGDTYRRALARIAQGEKPAMLSQREVLVMIPERLEAIERRLEGLLASDAAVSVSLIDLAREIRAWTTRQPIYVELRPRHDRKIDGGQGGTREARTLKTALTHAEDR